jgi:hypothetical protein
MLATSISMSTTPNKIENERCASHLRGVASTTASDNGMRGVMSNPEALFDDELCHLPR